MADDGRGKRHFCPVLSILAVDGDIKRLWQRMVVCEKLFVPTTPQGAFDLLVAPSKDPFSLLVQSFNSSKCSLFP